MQDVPDREQMFTAEENGKLIYIPVANEMVEKQIDRPNRSNHQDPMKYIQDYLRNGKRLLVNL